MKPIVLPPLPPPVEFVYSQGGPAGSTGPRETGMNNYAWLFEIAKGLLSESDANTPEVILRRVLAATGAERGFIVVREGDSYVQRFDVQFDRRSLSTEERRFSQSLVKQAIRTGEIIYSADLSHDQRFAELESIRLLGRTSVLVAPLRHAEGSEGAVYLERRSDAGFPEDARWLVREFTEMAGLFLRRAIERDALRRRNQSLEHDLFARYDFKGIITQHPGMIALLRKVAQVASSDAAVLIHGETGTGKELIAQALHVNSERRSKPLVPLHTMALSGQLLESELFGHVQGAFTGATRERLGRLASANGGTLFLDEVADITPEVQVKLLRFLDYGEIQRVGSDRTEKIDVRVIAATHKDLPALVRDGHFRQDLYHRLKMIQLEIPPLRERTGDIPLLVAHFLGTNWKRDGERPRWTASAERALAMHAYPGNVRELAYAVKAACVMATSPELDIDVLPEDMRPTEPEAPGSDFREFTGAEHKAARAAAQQKVDIAFLKGLMERHQGNAAAAARESGIHRGQLHKLLTKYGIKHS
ncbi:sigma 54-interacting transcriptional regulator [Sorangium sp. So ce185]|uniref:sigma-54 interaction domain-containing protein n=1 Tax=Sorangium sp. So ce185 TaxID=3133287 RepID=UPI003F62362F